MTSLAGQRGKQQAWYGPNKSCLRTGVDDDSVLFMTEATLRHEHVSVPLHVLKLQVIDGPDAGASIRLRDARIGVGSAKDNQLVLSDRAVSRYHAELVGRSDGVQVVDLGSTNGTFADGIRLERALVPPGTALKLGGTTVRVLAVESLVAPAAKEDQLCGIVGSSEAMRRLMYLIQRAGGSDASTLIVGESGTGKELVASALHRLSKRSQGPFVTVDCGSLAPTLIASTLFGHERGAFTGAHKQRLGAFERADGGTLFLDEIGELPAELQATLLGALERRQIQRVGGDEAISFDARVVCATHRDLREAVNKETFRLDLYYRLAVLKLHIPPLRERPQDIAALCTHFLRDAGESGSAKEIMGEAALARLQKHRFPGNVRELRNIVEASLVMGELPELEEFGSSADSALLKNVRERSYGEARKAVLAAFERDYLSALMDRCNQVVSRAARAAKMDRSHLTDLLKRHGLKD